MELIKIVHELRKAQGTNAKLDILMLHKDNDMWKTFLLYTYDERLSYGVSAPQTFDFDLKIIDANMFFKLDKLISRELSGNDAKNLVTILSHVYGEIPRLVLGRSVKAGISIKTINKAYDNFIPVFETMKGKDVPFGEFPMLGSIKYDGCKVFVEVTKDEVKIMSSSGTEFLWEDLKKEFSTAMYGVYEGELVYKNGKLKDRSVITGKLNSLLAGNLPDMSFCYFKIYDFIELSDWVTKQGTISFINRHFSLKAQFETGFQDSAIVKLVEQHVMMLQKDAEKFYEELILSGYEGAMYRYSEDVYMWTGEKRTERLNKKKSIRSCILTCVGVKPHSNPHKGIVGSLILEGTIVDKLVGEVFVKVSTGSGLSKFDINSEPERYLGEQIDMSYNSVTKTENGRSLFLPRFKRIVK